MNEMAPKDVCATLAGGSVRSETPTTHLGDIGVTFDTDKIFH